MIVLPGMHDLPETHTIRQAEIASLATGIGGIPHRISYLPEEHATWESMQAQLAPVRERYAAPELLGAWASLDLPKTRIPQLSLVSDRLYPRTGFRYASVPGTVPGQDFFGALADSVFPSTQFIRSSGDSGYTPQPDVLHEVGGHAASLAVPELAELHRLAGCAAVAAPSMLTAIASVFWYSVEFGVVEDAHGWRAFGAGLLSSVGELGWFAAHADIRPLNIAEMISTPYDINRYQPVLFGADSLDHVYDVVGRFYLDIISLGSAAGATQLLVPNHLTQNAKNN